MVRSHPAVLAWGRKEWVGQTCALSGSDTVLWGWDCAWYPEKVSMELGALLVMAADCEGWQKGAVLQLPCTELMAIATVQGEPEMLGTLLWGGRHPRRASAMS